MKNNKKNIVMAEVNNPDYLVPTLPKVKNENSSYSLISQGNIINSLNTFTHKHTVTTFNGNKEITNGKLKVIFDNKMGKLDTTIKQFLLVINIFIKKLNITQNDFVIPLSAYMEFRGLKDKKETTKNIKKISDVLLGIKITGGEKYITGGEINFLNRRIFYKCEVHNGLIAIGLEPDCFKLFYNQPFWGKFNNKLLNSNYLNVHDNPHTFNLGSKIQELKNINLGKKTENRPISVKTLLESTDLPTIELIKAQRGSARHKIIEPFIRDMLKLEDIEILKFEFCKNKGAKITEKELETIYSDYSAFINSFIKVTWLDYPDTKEITKQKEKTKKRRNKKRL